MLPKQRVAWVEGMLMEPQHFQQQERFFEHLIDTRARSLRPFGWGFVALEIDRGLLEQGKFALRKAKGIFPDGTPFSMPEDVPIPLPLELGDGCQGKVICLSVLLDIPGNAQMDLLHDEFKGSRFRTLDAEIADRNHGASLEGTPRVCTLQLGSLVTRLSLAEGISSAESALPVGFVLEVTSDRRICLDERALPPLLDFRAIGWLPGATTELLGLISQRLESVFRPDVHRTAGGLSELLELLLLQTLSAYNLRLNHLLSCALVHPETLFETLLSLLGSLSIIPGGERLWDRPDLVYLHDEPHNSYFQLFASIRRALSLVIEAPAVALSFIDRGDGIYLCQNDSQLRLEKLVFAVSCSLSGEHLRSYFPAQVKLGAVEKIIQLIDLQLPGARLTPMASPPRHIPYYPHSIYFEVDHADPLYKEMMAGSALALSIVGDFPDLHFDVWGLRQGRIG
ncbi:type VI secretion system baseplate subunit TssK [Pseudomonas chlororaphis]|uniref:Type VI secretion protein, TssK family n=1 Tax=Pseudomonas chlororaphis O6 TaxID=1037915 RepID=A0AB33X0B3_9PSED|nr:type VI secretion system baseplate subunit TssK [Pseudomonas chlororaphis]EIM18770.1 type VI secretion protein, TssK family [Pseudomonas chlororaphis O6]